MKNIYILPTDKPSRLGYLTKKGKEVYKDLRLFGRLMPNILDSENQNISITSDKEISGFENNIWVIKGDRIFLWQNTMALVSNNKPRKIILTTDQDLINDGVQEINYEFLEWFVKNPSCEKVEIRYSYPTIDDEGDGSISEGYWLLIIPEEEPKQRLEKYSERFDNKDNQIVEGIFNSDTWGKRIVEEHKQEITLKEEE